MSKIKEGDVFVWKAYKIRKIGEETCNDNFQAESEHYARTTPLDADYEWAEFEVIHRPTGKAIRPVQE